MAIPFKPEHFIFRRQAKLEKELLASLRFGTFDAKTALKSDQAHSRRLMTGGLPVPPRVMPALDQATLTIKTVARLPYEITTIITREYDSPGGTFALREGNQLTFKLAPKLLQGGSAADLVYHLAVAALATFQPVAFFLFRMLSTRPALLLDERLKLLELLRLGRYACDCFALVCCGDLDTVRREGFYRYTGLRPGKGAVDFDRLADDLLEDRGAKRNAVVERHVPRARLCPTATAGAKALPGNGQLPRVPGADRRRVAGPV